MDLKHSFSDPIKAIGTISPLPESRNEKSIAPRRPSQKDTVTKAESSYSPIKVSANSPKQVKSKTQETNGRTISLQETTKVPTLKSMSLSIS
jgi:hypothetical protein